MSPFSLYAVGANIEETVRWHLIIQAPSELFSSHALWLFPRTRKSRGVVEPTENAHIHTLLKSPKVMVSSLWRSCLSHFISTVFCVSVKLGDRNLCAALPPRAGKMGQGPQPHTFLPDFWPCAQTRRRIGPQWLWGSLSYSLPKTPLPTGHPTFCKHLHDSFLCIRLSLEVQAFPYLTSTSTRGGHPPSPSQGPQISFLPLLRTHLPPLLWTLLFLWDPLPCSPLSHLHKGTFYI